MSEAELKSFESWLNSPWCNSNKNLIRLFERIKKYYPSFDKPRLTKEKLFYQILPNGKFSTRRMNNLLSEGYLSLERFLIFQHLSKDQILQKNLLTQEFQNRHLEDSFFKNANQVIDQLEEKEVKDWEDHLALLQLHRRIYHHPNQNPRMQPGGSTIIEMGDQIDLIFLLEKAAIINEKISRNRILKNENHDFETELKKWKVISAGVEHPAIEFYKMRFAYSEENRLEKFLELRKALIERFEELNEKEQKIHFVSLLNDASLLVRAGLMNITETLPLYKLGLKSGKIFHQGILTYKTYVTIVSASNAQKDFDFTLRFINEYTKRLDKPFQVDASQWAIAHTASRQQKFNDSLHILSDHSFKIYYFLLLSKLLTTQIYFDLLLQNDSFQTYLFSYFDSFEKWILREKFRSEFTKKSYLRFVQNCRALAKHYVDADFQVKKVENLFENETNIQASNWLHQKKKEVISLRLKRNRK